MFIKSLSLRNFKTIRRADFRFHKGIICFTGNNGEGKSTVLHAILLLLFNTTYEGTLKDSIRWGEREFSISMEFEHEGEVYKESIFYSLTKGTERLLENVVTGETFTGASAISKLAEIIDPEQARAAIVSMENEQNLITTTPSQRREYLKKIYSLEFKSELQKIALDTENVERDIITTQTKKDVLVASDFPLKDEKELPDKAVYEEAKETLRRLESELKELKTQQEKSRSLRMERLDEEDNKRKIEKQALALKESIQTLERQIEENQSSLQKLSGIDYDVMESDAIGNLTYDYEAQRADLQSRLEEARAELEKIPSVPVRISRSKYEKLSSRKSELSASIQESSRKLEVLKTGKCPTCGRDISPEEASKEEQALKALIEEHLDVSEELSAETNRINKLQEENDLNTQNKERWSLVRERVTQELNSVDRTFASDKEKISLQYQTKRAELKGKLDTLTAKIESDESTIESNKSLIEMYKEQILACEGRIEKLRSEIEKYDNLEDFIERNKLQQAEPGYIIKDYEDAVDYNKSVRVYNEEMKKKSEERDQKVEQLSKDLEALTSKKAMIAVAKGIVQKEFPSFVISRMVQSLSDYVNEFLEKVYPKYRVSIEEGKNSLNILYGEYKTDVKMASGFEKSAFSLAYMYALGKLQAYGLLICDEGDAAASDENSAKFYRMLGRSTEWLGQIMCITHKEEIKDLLRNDFRAQIFTVENGEYREEIA